MKIENDQMSFLEFASKQIVCMMKCANWRLVYMQFCKTYKTHSLMVNLNIIVVCNIIFDPDFADRFYVISVERAQPCKYVISVKRVRSCKYVNLEVYFTCMNLL